MDKYDDINIDDMNEPYAPPEKTHGRAAQVIEIVQRSSWLKTAARVLAAMAVLALVIVLARWDAASARDHWWRTEIERKSDAVRNILRESGADIIEGDAARVAELERENNDLREQNKILEAARARTPLSVDCSRCRIPAGRLRTR